MSDNSTLPGTGDVYASDDIGGVKFPRVKLITGSDGVNDGDISAANPFPVVQATGAVLNAPSGIRATVYGVSGAGISSANPLPVSVPSGLFATVTVPSGLGLLTPSGFALSGGTGAPISLANPLPIRTPTLAAFGLVASGLPVSDTNPLPITGSLSTSIGTGTAVGLVASGLPVSVANALPVGSPSGFALSGGTGAPITAANPLPVRIFSGFFMGLSASGLPVSAANPLPVSSTPSTDPVPVSQATGGQFLVTARQATGTVNNIAQGTGAQFLVTARQATGHAFLADQATGTNWKVTANSPEAHGSNPTGGPLLVGFQGRGANPVPVASGAVAQGFADTLGKQVVMPFAPVSLRLSNTVGVQGTGARTLFAAQGSGTSIAVTSLSVVNGSPSFASMVVIRDGVATLYGGHAYDKGGGFAPNGGGYPLFVSAPNAAIDALCLASGADVTVNISGFKLNNP